MKVRRGTAGDAPRALEIWRAAVDATHQFLSAEHRGELDRIVEEFTRTAELWMVDDERQAVGFLVVDDDLIDALFVDPAVHGRGFGTALLRHALDLAPRARVDANEQAANAVVFYEARGFERTGRSERDPNGWPYPLVHLRYRGGKFA